MPKADRRIDMRISADELDMLRLLWRETQHDKQSFTRWLLEPRLDEVKEILG